MSVLTGPDDVDKRCWKEAMHWTGMAGEGTGNSIFEVRSEEHAWS